MQLKLGVRLEKLQPQTVLAMLVVNDVCWRWGVECVLTSVNDSKHMAKSWHYEGRAFDVRTKYPELDGREQEFRDEVARDLGPNYDVTIEAIGTEDEHLHVEYDPK